MAGTPTTNYNIPTYADTDAPDLSGAYNDAMGIIDTQLKANADAIESASTGNYTGTAPITVDNEGRSIGVAQASLNEDGSSKARGTVDVTGKASDISNIGSITSAKVPNLRAVADYVAAHGGTEYTAGDGISISDTTISGKQATGIASANIADVEESGVNASFRGIVAATANNGDVVDRIAAINDEQHGYPGNTVVTVVALKQYVESKMASAGAAYTGTAPVVVNNGSHTISVTRGVDVDYADDAYQDGSPSGAYMGMNSTATLHYLTTGDTPSGAHFFIPSLSGLRSWVVGRTPDASTSVKGLVQLTSSPYGISSDTLAVSPNGLTDWMSKMYESATTPVTVDMLSKLHVGTNGVVFYKA